MHVVPVTQETGAATIVTSVTWRFAHQSSLWRSGSKEMLLTQHSQQVTTLVIYTTLDKLCKTLPELLDTCLEASTWKDTSLLLSQFWLVYDNVLQNTNGLSIAVDFGRERWVHAATTILQDSFCMTIWNYGDIVPSTPNASVPSHTHFKTVSSLGDEFNIHLDTPDFMISP